MMSAHARQGGTASGLSLGQRRLQLCKAVAGHVVDVNAAKLNQCSRPDDVGVGEGYISDPSVWLVALVLFDYLQVPHLKPGRAVHGDGELQIDWPYTPLDACSQGF